MQKKLNKKDYREIRDLAHKKWIEKAHTGDIFNCECYIEAFIDWTVKNGLVIKNGKIYDKEENN